MVAGFIKKGVREMMIARPDEFKEAVVWKHPDETVPFGSQLTVDADEAAVWFKDGGKHTAVFPPGRHTLTSANIPFLSNFVDTFTGGNVLKAEVFYVLTRQIPNVKFGGPVGDVSDPETHVMTSLRVNGSFSLRVVNPQSLITGLWGMQKANNDGFLQWFREQVLKVMRDRIGELIDVKNMPVLKVTSAAMTEELEEMLIEGLKKHTIPLGVEVVQTGNFVINIPDEAKEEIKQAKRTMAYMNMAGGNPQMYQQLVAGRVMMNAGDAMAKGGPGGGQGEGGGGQGQMGNMMMGGAGLGVGFGMAQMFAGAVQPAGYGHGYPPQPGYPPPQQGYPQQPGYPPPQGGVPPMQPQVPGAAMAGAAAGAAMTAGTAAAAQPAQAMVTCPHCNASVVPGKFCAECGKPIPVPAGPAKKFCPSCGLEANGPAKFCASCGTKIQE